MITILKPQLINNNKIKYPVEINDILYNFEISYDLNLKLNLNIDGIVCMMLPIAICNNLTIKSQYPIDSQLYKNLFNIKDNFIKYYDIQMYGSQIKKEHLNLILDIPTIDRSKNSTNINITPISMGIDSLHTVLTNLNSITHLINIEEMDLSYKIPIIKNNIIDLASKYEKHIIFAKSNFKKIILSLDLYGTNYGVFTSEFIMLASCYPISFDTIYFSGMGGDIPCLISQHSAINSFLISNEFDSINNLTTRVKKLKFILKKDFSLLNKIRICNDEIADRSILNCGKCGKCARTMCYFYMLGVYNRLKTFNFLPANINYVDYYMENYFNKPDKILATKFYDMIFENIYFIYKQDGNLGNIEKYNFEFINNKNIIIKI